MQQTIIWERWNSEHMEHLRLEERDDEIIADGTIVGVDSNLPFRAHYRKGPESPELLSQG
jgi:hypothetical protein